MTDEGDGEGEGDASWADPLWWTHHSGRFELRAQLTHSSQRSDCSRWTERALASFRDGEDRRHNLLALLRRSSGSAVLTGRSGSNISAAIL